uniref:E4 protein n=1 Tax=Human papillomavirus TaxID=10566 RepID=A0A385PJ59_9PAPI|nr:MAG: E4 protein [Human papillomavirus]
MACTIKNQMETECILNYLTLMHKSMEHQVNGLCNLNQQLFLLLSPALPATPQHHPRSASVGPPTPRPGRKFHPDDFKLPKSLARRALLPPDDDDSNKENQPYQQKDDEEAVGLLDDAISHLLKKWEEDIEQLREQVFRELDGCKKRLGIR